MYVLLGANCISSYTIQYQVVSLVDQQMIDILMFQFTIYMSELSTVFPIDLLAKFTKKNNICIHILYLLITSFICSQIFSSSEKVLIESHLLRSTQTPKQVSPGEVNCQPTIRFQHKFYTLSTRGISCDGGGIFLFRSANQHKNKQIK